MTNLPFAFFNLGAQELIILGLLGVVGIGVAVAIVIAMASSKNRDD
jgi:hypothetical protein